MSRAAIILDSDFQRKKAADWVWALKDGTRVEFKGPKRTLDQNSLFWVLLTEVAVQLKWHGQKLTPDDWKLQFLDALRRSKREELHIVPNTDNTGFVNLSTSSSDLSKEEMTELIELIFAFGAAHGVTFNTSNAPAAANDAGSSRAANGEPERFLRDVVLKHDSEECLPWPYAKDSDGYGVVKIDGRQQPVSRIVCREVHGEPPTPEHEAAHNCGNGHESCCNWRHLEWKTHADNMADTIEHGTSGRGEQSGMSKLTESQVLEIRSASGTNVDIAKRFGVSERTVGHVKNGTTWGWLNSEQNTDMPEASQASGTLADPSPLGEQSSGAGIPDPDSAGTAATNSDEATKLAMVPDADSESTGDPASTSAASAPNSAQGTTPETGADADSGRADALATTDGTVAPESSGEEEKAADGCDGAVSSSAAELSEEDRTWLRDGARMLLATQPSPDDREAKDVLKRAVLGIRENTAETIGAAARDKLREVAEHCMAVCKGEVELHVPFVALTALATVAEITPAPVKTARAK